MSASGGGEKHFGHWSIKVFPESAEYCMMQMRLGAEGYAGEPPHASILIVVQAIGLSVQPVFAGFLTVGRP